MRSPGELFSTAEEIQALGVSTLAQSSDVQNQKSLVSLKDAVVNQFGRVDILVVSSGMNIKIPTTEMSEDAFQQVIDTNLTGTFRANQVFGQQMIAQKGGSIVNIASIAGVRPILQMTAYSASKAGVISMTQSLGQEWAPFNVRVNAIAPGPFRTPLSERILSSTPGRIEYLLSRVPMHRFGELEEITGAALFLASDASSFVTGDALRVDGGLMLTNF